MVVKQEGKEAPNLMPRVNQKYNMSPSIANNGAIAGFLGVKQEQYTPPMEDLQPPPLAEEENKAVYPP